MESEDIIRKGATKNITMVWFISFFTLAGLNFTIWLIIGLIRLFFEQFSLSPPSKEKQNISINEIGVIIPAHNEESTIDRTLEPLIKVFPKRNIYVASDYSIDNTIEIVRKVGVRSLDIKPNKGKARSLVHIMSEYGLLDAYKFIMINDADTVMGDEYLAYALPFFQDPDIAAVATHGVTRWKDYTFWQRYFIAYRIRLWRIIQWGTRFGQTWKYTNVSFIIPGSLNIYRTSVLKQLEIDAPGLIIEDFNMTFEVHKKKLGKIGYNSHVIGIHQDPYNLHDYIRQVQRWNVGFFQTVKRHGIWPSLFWLTTTLYYLELYIYALFMVSLPIILIIFILRGFMPIQIPFLYFYRRLTIVDVLIGVFLMDYLTTIIAAILERKPFLFFYGIGFIFLRYIDSLIYLSSPIIAFTKSYTGKWESPKRL
jgi:poly-beta-1,6-N-acetyl-D-glucosamine synthase